MSSLDFMLVHDPVSCKFLTDVNVGSRVWFAEFSDSPVAIFLCPTGHVTQ